MLKPIFLKLAISFALLVAGPSLAAELGKVTGGGKIIDVQGTKEVTVTFKADSCKNEAINQAVGGINVVDKASNLHFKGNVVAHAKCNESSLPAIERITECSLICEPRVGQGAQMILAKSADDGYVLLCVNDFGEGSNGSPDQAYLYFSKGQYKGYTQTGQLNGNVQVQGCK